MQFCVNGTMLSWGLLKPLTNFISVTVYFHHDICKLNLFLPMWRLFVSVLIGWKYVVLFWTAMTRPPFVKRRMSSGLNAAPSWKSLSWKRDSPSWYFQPYPGQSWLGWRLGRDGEAQWSTSAAELLLRSRWFAIFPTCCSGSFGVCWDVEPLR